MRWAGKEPALLDEWVTFSKLAGDTAGTTAGIKPGERIDVVVLGCSSDDGRYADARNLFRWAWARRK